MRESCNGNTKRWYFIFASFHKNLHVFLNVPNRFVPDSEFVIANRKIVDLESAI